ncbi:MAG TPA: hypothetical protein VK601_24310 [Kofleriaceae bacterium]|nr:hypothetical protein [Kofleriaceae bacterium]
MRTDGDGVPLDALFLDVTLPFTLDASAAGIRCQRRDAAQRRLRTIPTHSQEPSDRTFIAR